MNKQIISNLKKILNNLNQKKFSLINIYPEDVYDFKDLQESLKNKLENSVVVQNKNKFTLEDIKLIPVKTFQEKEIEIYEKTRNGVLIWEKNFNKLEGLQAYYPIIFIKNVEDEVEFKNKFEEELNDWQTSYTKKENLMLLINKNIKAFKSFTFHDFLIDSSVKIQNKKVEIDEQLKSKDYINYDIFSNLPKPTINPPDRKNIKWCQEFYNYIYEILKIIVPENKQRMIDYIINKKTFKDIWLKAFTHFTFKPDVSENYEALEHIGDRAMKHAFIDYYYERYPYSTAGDLTNASKQTQSDEEQSELGSKLGLTNWVCLDDILKGNMKLNEDLLEAFAGAIDISLYQAGIIGGSIPILNNMFKLLYQDRDLRTEIDAPTWLNQFIEQIALKPKDNQHKKDEDKKIVSLPRPKQIDPNTYNKIIKEANRILEKEGSDNIFTSEKIEKKKDTGIVFDEYVTEDKKIKIDVRLNEYGAKILRNYGFSFRKNQILGSAIESTKTPAKRHASDNAKSYLEKFGINKKWVEYQSFKKKMSSLEGLEEKVLLKAKKKYKDIVILGVKDKTVKKDAIYVLYGENKKGYKYFLESYVSDGTPDNNHLNVVKKFLKI